MHKKLFIPGPVEVRQDVLEKMATPMIGHRTKEISQLQRGISDKLKKLFYTKNQIMLSTSSGSGFMEGAVRSCTSRKAAVFSVGAFGKRWYKMATSNGIPADLYETEMGQATTPELIQKALASSNYDLVTITHNETSTGVMNPIEEISEVMKKYPDVIFCVDAVSSAAGTKIEVDKLGIDICITSTQKALGLPPGLAICTMSEKAYERAKTVKNRGLYFDMVEIYETIEKKDHQYPSTPNISLMYALDYQLDRILAEGLDNRFTRHLEMASLVRDWTRRHFALFADERYLSNTLTTVNNTRQISVKDLNTELGKRGFSISNGYGDLKEKTFRIAHMADMTSDEVKELLDTIDEILDLK
jgi:aspartate aminotransferase-like enzyme